MNSNHNRAIKQNGPFLIRLWMKQNVVFFAKTRQ
jgi:hypothetical protein